MPTLINTTVQNHRRGSRIWLEGIKIQREGFLPGKRYRIEERQHSLVLIICDAGSHTISKRRRGHLEVPVIDITNRRLEIIFQGFDRLRVLVRLGCIVITVHHHCLNRSERVERFVNNIQNKLALSIGSLFHGGGILDKAMHQGFNDAGLDTIIRVAVEIDGQYLDTSISNNSELWDDSSVAVQSGVQHLNFQGRSSYCDGVVAGIPCTGASPSGRSKLKLAFAEDHESAGACFYWFLLFVQSANPAFVIIENVPAYASTASASVIRSVLDTLGYRLQERVFGGNAFGSLEDRHRWVMVAISDGLHEGFDLQSVQPICEKPASLGDVLEPVPFNSPVWKSYNYLAEKEKADVAEGKGFRRQLLSSEDTKCGTIGRSYNKARSTEPFLQHPVTPSLSRLFTPTEHARLKGIPENIVDGLKPTIAHEVLGQSVIFPVFKAIAGSLAIHFISAVNARAETT